MQIMLSDILQMLLFIDAVTEPVVIILCVYTIVSFIQKYRHSLTHQARISRHDL